MSRARPSLRSARCTRLRPVPGAGAAAGFGGGGDWGTADMGQFCPAPPPPPFFPMPPWHGPVRPSSTMRAFTLSDFDFDLPPELVAQHPASERSASRLLDGTGSAPVDRIFNQLPALLRQGDLLVFNDTRVVKARLFGEKPTGGKLELLVERVLQGAEVVAHMKVSKKPPVGTTLAMAGGFTATLLGRWPEEDGALFRFRFQSPSGEDPYALMARCGHVPLPPYITHTDSSED